MFIKLAGIIVVAFAVCARPLAAAEGGAPLKVASIQMEVAGDTAVNLARIERGITEAAEAGARLALFPETALSGFNRETIQKLNWPALAGAMEMIAALAAEHRLYVIYGTATPSGKERPHNTAIVLGPDGHEITRYHKMSPEDWFEPGDHLALFEIEGTPCTMMICHDERFPEITRLPVLAGARVCFYISYEINRLDAAERKAEGYRAQLIARAVENGIWVCQANGVGPLGESASKSLGQSRFVAPDGVVVAEAPPLVDTMLVREIDPGAAGRGNAVESLKLNGLGDWWSGGLKFVDKGAPATAERKDGAAAPESAPARDKVKLSLMQAVPKKWNLEANFEAFLSALETAEKKKAEIFITPECWLDGYAATAKDSTPERLRGIAQPLTGSRYLERVAREARERAMHICFGFTSLEGGKVFNAAGLWNDKGELVGVYHKTHLQEHDLQFAAGDALPVWSTPWGPVGIMICADRRWPETARTLRLKGARLILNPTYGMHGESNEALMRTRAYENQCFVAFAHPELGLVTGPSGKIEAKREEKPGVLICDIDLGEAKDDNHLRDRRPELYRAITAPNPHAPR